MDESIRLIGLGDIKKLNPRPNCHHNYYPYRQNLKCSKCGKVVFVVPSTWQCPEGWKEVEISSATYDIHAPI